MDLIPTFMKRTFLFFHILIYRFMRYKYGCYLLMILGLKLLFMLIRHILFPLIGLSRSRIAIALLGLLSDTIILTSLLFLYPLISSNHPSFRINPINPIIIYNFYIIYNIYCLLVGFIHSYACTYWEEFFLYHRNK